MTQPLLRARERVSLYWLAGVDPYTVQAKATSATARKQISTLYNILNLGAKRKPEYPLLEQLLERRRKRGQQA